MRIAAARLKSCSGNHCPQKWFKLGIRELQISKPERRPLHFWSTLSKTNYICNWLSTPDNAPLTTVFRNTDPTLQTSCAPWLRQRVTWTKWGRWLCVYKGNGAGKSSPTVAELRDFGTGRGLPKLALEGLNSGTLTFGLRRIAWTQG